MPAKNFQRIGIFSSFVLLLLVLVGTAPAAVIKVKVIANDSPIYMQPVMSAQTLAIVPLNKVLEAEVKQGEFYKVKFERDGIKSIGYIHEMLVRELGEGETESGDAPLDPIRVQNEIAAQIAVKIEGSKEMIKLEKDLALAVENLRPLIAKLFSLDDRQKQKQTACDIYLWLGIAEAKLGDGSGAIREFRNMFEVDYVFAKSTTRYVSEPAISSLIDNAEKQHKGLVVEYTFKISTEPKEATVKIDGKAVGSSPYVHATKNPKFTLEIEKDGYASVKESIFLTETASEKSYPLQSVGRTLKVSSTPAGARVFLDGQDTGRATECELPFIRFGERRLKLTLENYAEWEEPCQVVEGPGPFLVSALLTAKNYVSVKKLGGPDGKFLKLPKAVAVDKSGNIYIADGSDFKVRRFDQEFGVQLWSDPGLTIRKLDEPAGIAFDSQDNIYVTDSKSSRVVKFDRNGREIFKWGRQGVRAGELNAPTGLAIDKNNDIYVADTGNNRIVKYSNTGTVKKGWGKQGTGPGDFYAPTGVAVNAKNEIIVVDKGGRVQKFTPDGAFISAFGKAGTADGELARPLGFCVDGDGYIYVADTGNNRIQKFAPDGKLVTQLGGGTSGGQITGPSGIAINDKGDVFVVERELHQVHVFRVPGK
jgi:DNA-binding beta-propeller fold protein YncE